MNTSDIRAALTSDVHARPRLAGVFSYDQVVRNIAGENERIYVFNTQPSLRPGEHWMVFATRNSEAHYFDSFGRHPRMYPQLSTTLERTFKTIYWNNTPFQSPSTTVCGDYTVIFALLFARGHGLQDIVNWFATFPNSEVRDHTLRSMLVKTYGDELFACYREDRPGLSGAQNLHVDRVAKTIGQPCIFS